MSQELWTDVDHYLTDSLHEPDASLDAALEASAAAGLPPIQVSTNQGKLLHLLRASKERAGSSKSERSVATRPSGWPCALPAGGKLISLELEPLHAEVARENLQRAGLGGVAEVRLGRAIDSLAALSGETPEPFDFVFIDADKPSNADYFEWALRLTKPGSVIVVDNVVRGGAVADSNSTNEAVLGVRRLHDLIHGDPRVTATGIQTVGTKGYDGFTLALVV